MRSKNVAVLGVNPQSAASHTGFRQQHKLPFPLLVDKGQKVAARYKASGLMIKRTVYLIGPQGTILFARRGMPSPDEVLAAMK